MDETVDRQMISKIYHHGGFTPEFTAALKQQIGLIQKGNHAEEWLISIIQRELEAQGLKPDQSVRKIKSEGSSVSSPRVILHDDDDDCYLELLLPSEKLTIDKSRCHGQKTYCTVSLESLGRIPKIISEVDIDDKQQSLSIPEIRFRITEEQEEFVIKLRHAGLDNAVLHEWSCDGLTNRVPYILFDTDTKEIISQEKLSETGLSLMFNRSWDVDLTDGIESEYDEPIRVSKLGQWRLLFLSKTSPQENVKRSHLLIVMVKNLISTGVTRIIENPLLNHC